MKRILSTLITLTMLMTPIIEPVIAEESETAEDYSVSVTAEKTEIEIGETLDLNVSVMPKTEEAQAVEGYTAVYASSDESAATVDGSGKVTGVSSGTSTITVTVETTEAEVTKKGTGTLEVTVKAAEEAELADAEEAESTNVEKVSAILSKLPDLETFKALSKDEQGSLLLEWGLDDYLDEYGDEALTEEELSQLDAEKVALYNSLVEYYYQAVSEEVEMQADSDFVIDSNGVLTKYNGSETNVIIPESVTSIGENAFNGCTSLMSIYIPSRVTAIEESAFYNCSSDLILYFESDAMPGQSSPLKWTVSSNGTYKFTNTSGSTWTSNNTDINSSTATTTWSINLSSSTTISIPWTVSSESGYDKLTITLDGTTVVSAVSGTKSGTITETISAGTHTLVGTYSKDSSAKSGSDNAALVLDPIVTVSPYTNGTVDLEYWFEITSADYSFLTSLTGTETTVTIPEGVTKIPANAFKNNTNLTSVAIPSTVTSIGTNAFDGCTSLKSIYIPSTVATISAISYSNSPFYNCSSELVIYTDASEKQSGWESYWNYYASSSMLNVCYGTPSNEYERWTSIDRTATNIVIPDGVTVIPANAFKNNTNLTGVTISSAVTLIGSNAFEGCTSLRNIYIPSTVETINAESRVYSPFYNCSSELAIYTDASSNQNGWGWNWFYNGLYSSPFSVRYGTPSNEYEYWASLSPTKNNIVIPDGITAIPDYAFFNRDGLKSVTIPASVTSIGKNAFGGCTSVSQLTVPVGVTAIGDNAFNGVQEVLYTGTATGRPWGAKCSYAAKDDNFAYSDVEKTIINKYIGTGGDVVIPDGVVEIASFAFESNKTIKNVVIPEGVKKIGDYAFRYASNLTSIVIPGTVESIGYECFYHYQSDSSKLSSVTISEGVKTIGDYAFYNNTQLKEITIPSSVTTIGAYSFYGDFRLDSVTFGEGLKTIGKYAFYQCWLSSVSIPDSVTSIGSQAFYCTTGIQYTGSATGAPWSAKYVYAVQDSEGFRYGDAEKTKLVGYVGTAKEVTIPEGVKEIGYSAFNKNTSITSVIIPNTVTTIEYNSFNGCTSLEEIVIPNSVTTIGNASFYGCTSLEEIVIPDSVITIGDSAFGNCTNLKKLTIGSGLTTLNKFYSGCSNLETLVLNANISTVPDYAFQDFKNLKSVTIGDGITSIGYAAFDGCSAIDTVVIPSSVTSIGKYAFSDCKKLDIPTTVTSIVSNAFYNVKVVNYYGTATGSPWGALTLNPSSIDDGGFVYADEAKTTVISYVGSNTDVVIPDTVTTISISAFANDANIKTVKFPEGLIEIKDSAFWNCTGLTSVSIPANTDKISFCAFSGCTNVKELTIPARLSSNIGLDKLQKVTLISSTKGNYGFDYAYYNSSGKSSDLKYYQNSAFYKSRSTLTSVTIADGVETIGSNTFRDCYNINTLKLSDALTSIGEYAFYNNEITQIEFPENLTSIRSYAFYSNNMTEIEFPSGLKSISEHAFENCDYLKTVELPEDVTFISYYAFANCDRLTNVVIPNSVTSIGYRAFYYCKSLSSLTVPNTVAYINSEAFYGITEVEYGGTATGRPWGAKYVYAVKDENGLLYSDYEKTILCGSLNTPEMIVIPEGVVTIENEVFKNCSSLKSVTLPDSLKSIGARVFYGCSALKEIEIPDSVTSIGNNCFGNSGLEKIKLPISAQFNTCSDQISSNLKTIVISAGKTGVGCDYSSGSYTYTPWYLSRSYLENLELEEGIVTIGAYSFAYNTYLKSITIPQSVKTIKSYAFAGATSLESVTIPDTVEVIDANAFKDVQIIFYHGDATGSNTKWGAKYLNPIIGEGGLLYDDAEKTVLVGYIGDATKVEIPDTVTTIVANAFTNNNTVRELVVPDSVTSIGSNSFKGIEFVTYTGTATGSPWGAKYINPSKDSDNLVYADAEHTQLVGYVGTEVNITVPSNVTYIEDNVFQNVRVVFYEGTYEVNKPWGAKYVNPVIDDSGLLFEDSTHAKLVGYNGTGKEVIISGSVSTIDEEAFKGNEAIEVLKFESGDGLLVIGDSAFENCKNLRHIEFGREMDLQNYAFRNCTGITDNCLDFRELVRITGDPFNGCGQQYEELIIAGDAVERSIWWIHTDSHLKNIKKVEVVAGTCNKVCGYYALNKYFPNDDYEASHDDWKHVLTYRAWAYITNDIEIEFEDGLTPNGEATILDTDNVTKIRYPLTFESDGSEYLRRRYGTDIEVYNGTVSVWMSKLESFEFYSTREHMPANRQESGYYLPYCLVDEAIISTSRILPFTISGEFTKDSYLEYFDNKYGIIGDRNSGVNGTLDGDIALYGSQIKETLDKDRYHYVFIGWFDEEGNQYVSESENVITGDHVRSTKDIPEGEYVILTAKFAEEIERFNASKLTYTVGSGDKVQLHYSPEARVFTDVKMDGVIVQPSNYTVEHGSTIITFKQSYLDGLKEGTHIVQPLFSDGVADAVATTLVIKKKSSILPDTPTGGETVDPETPADPSTEPVVNPVKPGTDPVVEPEVTPEEEEEQPEETPEVEPEDKPEDTKGDEPGKETPSKDAPKVPTGSDITPKTDPETGNIIFVDPEGNETGEELFCDVHDRWEIQTPDGEEAAYYEAGKWVEISSEETPLANIVGTKEFNGSWALINLICTILTAVAFVLTALKNYRRKDIEKSPLMKPVIALAVAIIAIIVFILTEDMRLPMKLVDKYTILMVLILAVNVVIYLLKSTIILYTLIIDDRKYPVVDEAYEDRMEEQYFSKKAEVLTSEESVLGVGSVFYRVENDSEEKVPYAVYEEIAEVPESVEANEIIFATDHETYLYAREVENA